MLLTTLAFFGTTLSLSFALNLFIELKCNAYKQFFLRVGLGIAFFPVATIIMDFCFIPLNTWIILTASLIFPTVHLYRKKNALTRSGIRHYFLLKSRKEMFQYVLVFLMTLITAHMYISGSFSYSYLENGDPWRYATVSKVIAEKQTIKASYKYNHVAEPYSQGYQVLMGVLSQTNDSIYTTLKTFHNLILSLGILFYFFFAQELFKEEDRGGDIAFFSTAAFFCIPSWVSHFIFPLSLNMTLMPLFLLSLLKIREDSNWKFIAGIVFGGMILNHFFTAFMALLILFGYFLLKIVHSKEFNEAAIEVGVIGLCLSQFFYIPTSIRHPDYLLDNHPGSHGGLEEILYPLAKAFSGNFLLVAVAFLLPAMMLLAVSFSSRWFQPVKRFLSINHCRETLLIGSYAAFLALYMLPNKKFFSFSGTGTRLYTFKDFFYVSDHNMINNPIGWGVCLTVAIAIGFFILLFRFKGLFEKEKFATFFILNCALVFFLLVLGEKYSIELAPFRQWTFLALFVPILAGIGLDYLNNLKVLPGVFRHSIVLLFILLIVLTSFVPKYKFNTRLWPEHEIRVPPSYPFYADLREKLPKNSNVVNLCRDSNYLVSYDMLPPIEDRAFNAEFGKKAGRDKRAYKHFYEWAIEDTYRFLKGKEVEYAIIDASCLIGSKSGGASQKKLQRKIQEINSAPEKFALVTRSKAALLYKVN